jgi:Zn-dependent protease with chaperone function
MTIIKNPTEDIDIDFSRYLALKQQKASPHMVDGVPDYSFGMDNRLRQQLASIGPIRSAGRILQSTPESVVEQVHSLGGIPVSPKDFPEIYETGIECSENLGVGLPHMYVVDSEVRRAYTVAHEDYVPVVVLTTSLVENLDKSETSFVLGHEFGHTHNNHGIYNTTGQIITNPLAGELYEQSSSSGIYKGIVSFLASLVQGNLKFLMTLWGECADITCDRAGLICCGSAESAQQAIHKINDGDHPDQVSDPTGQEILEDEELTSKPYTGRLSHKTHLSDRIEAVKLFSDCDVMHAWRPDMNRNGTRYEKAEVEHLCAEMMGVSY